MAHIFPLQRPALCGSHISTHTIQHRPNVRPKIIASHTMSNSAKTDSTTPPRLFTTEGEAVTTLKNSLTKTERYNEYIKFGREIGTSYTLAIDPEPTGTLYAQACARWPNDETNFQRLKADLEAHGSDKELDKVVNLITLLYSMITKQLQDRGFFSGRG
jgi:hypothetical protein